MRGAKGYGCEAGNVEGTWVAISERFDADYRCFNRLLFSSMSQKQWPKISFYNWGIIYRRCIWSAIWERECVSEVDKVSADMCKGNANSSNYTKTCYCWPLELASLLMCKCQRRHV